MLNIKKIRSCFPILNCKVNGKDLIYLDNAATTSNNRKAIKGECAVCGTKIMRFVKSK